VVALFDDRLTERFHKVKALTPAVGAAYQKQNDAYARFFRLLGARPFS